MSRRPFVLTRAFQTTVARRVTVLLLGCALVPMGALAWLTLRRTTHELDLQARAQMHREVKAIAMNGVEQLALLSDKLRLLGVDVLSGAVPADAARTVFGDAPIPLAFETADDGFQPIRGTWQRPTLTSEQDGASRADGYAPDSGALSDVPGARAAGGDRGPRPARHRPWPHRSAGALEPGRDLLPASSTLCVFGGHVLLSCSREVSRGVIAALSALPADQAGTIADDRDALEVQTWTVPLGYAYGSEPLTLTMLRSRATVRAPLQPFVRDFWLVLSLAMLVVTLLSVAQVRRSLKPLDQLMTATGRLARRQFDTRLDITTRDEFEDLGEAINDMAAELKRQFDALEALNQGTLAALARAMTPSPRGRPDIRSV